MDSFSFAAHQFESEHVHHVQPSSRVGATVLVLLGECKAKEKTYHYQIRDSEAEASASASATSASATSASECRRLEA